MAVGRMWGVVPEKVTVASHHSPWTCLKRTVTIEEELEQRVRVSLANSEAESWLESRSRRLDGPVLAKSAPIFSASRWSLKGLYGALSFSLPKCETSVAP